MLTKRFVLALTAAAFGIIFLIGYGIYSDQFGIFSGIAFFIYLFFKSTGIYLAVIIIVVVAMWVMDDEANKLFSAKYSVNGSTQNTEQKPKQRNRRVSAKTLSECKEAMEYWLDEGKSLQEAADLAGTTDKTVRARIPNVLAALDKEKQAEWEKLLKALGELP